MSVLYERELSQPGFPFSAAIDRGESPDLYHWHEEIEIVYVLGEPVDVGIHNRIYHLGSGDILIIGSEETHCYFTAGADAKRLIVRFNLNLASPLTRESLEGERLLQRIYRVKRCSQEWPEASRDRVREILTRMYTESLGKETGYELAIRGLIFELMLVLVRELPEKEPAESDRQLTQDAGFKKALSFLMENYTRDISLKDCADALGFNMNYFSRFFRIHTGINFHEYLIMLRLKRAEWLLLSTGMSITEVVGQSGFQNVKTFNRVFKKAHNCSPREFRRQKAAS